VQVTLVDGKAHSVDSSDAAFQMAGGLAVKDAAPNAHAALIEHAVREQQLPEAAGRYRALVDEHAARSPIA